MDDKKYPQPIESIAIIIAVFMITFVILMIYPIYRLATGQPEMGMESTKYFLLLGVLPMLTLPYLYSRLRGYDTVNLFRLKAVPGNVLFMSVLIGIGISVVGDEIDSLVRLVVETPDFLEEIMVSMKAESPFDWILLISGVVFGAAFSEEMVFRGFLQVPLEEKGDVTKAVLLVSLAWTLFHTNPWWAIPIFIMGIVIGFLAWRTGSIIPGIIVHGVNNFLSLLYANYQEDLDWYTSGNHVSPLIFLPALAILVYSVYSLTQFYQSQDEKM
jgi:membrane protease YdiL (CAAX protease family)